MSKHQRSEDTSSIRSAFLWALSGLMLFGPAAFGQGSQATSQSTVTVRPAYRYQRPQASAQEIRALVQRQHALPEDPLAAVHRLLALAPVTEQSAAFVGNQTAITATPGNAFLMLRKPDCSLTALNAAFTLDPAATTYSGQSVSTHYEQVIHTAAGLTTTATEATGTCHDPGVGIASNTLIFVGLTTSGMRVGALAAYGSQAGVNQLFTVVSTASGTPVSTSTLASPSVAGTAPYSLASADLNQDGNNDLVSVNYGFATGNTPATSSVTIYLGNADGSFNSGLSYAIPNAVADGGLVIDDMDGDGKLDLVIPSALGFGSSSYQITFLPGKGDGTFGTAKTIPLPNAAASPLNLVTGDFNSDGKKDLVSGYGLMLLGNGDGTFTASASAVFDAPITNSIAGAQPAVGDFNKDGKLDLAVGTGTSIVVYLGNGDGTLQQGVSYASIGNHGYLTAVDLDGDSNLDLYSGDAGNGVFGGDDFAYNQGYALMGKGDGTFAGAQNTPISTVSGATEPIQFVQDLNGDGKLDLLALKIPLGSAGYFQTYLGRGDGSFTAGPVFSLANFMYMGDAYDLDLDSYTLVDVNHDGKADLVLLPTGGFPDRLALLVALGNGDGSFQTPTVVPLPSLIPGGGMDSPYQVTGLYSGTRADGTAELIYEFLSGSFQAPYNYYEGIATQIVNGDGTFGSPVLTVSGTFTGPNGTPALNVPTNVLDVNGDKTPDLIEYFPAVFQNVNGYSKQTSAAYYQLQLGNPDGTFGAVQTVNVVDNPSGGPITLADVNGDGKIDLVALGSSTTVSAGTSNLTSEIGVALGNGDGTFQAPKLLQLEAAGGGFESVAAADFDGDGKVDIAILGYDPPTDSGVFFGNGDGTFRGTASGNGDNLVIPVQPIYLTAYGNGLIADVNGDGKPDIIGSAVLVNQYNGSVTTPARVNTTTTLTASPSTVNLGQSVVLVATVAASSGSLIPTGGVMFLDGTASLGLATVNAQGLATLSVSTLSSGAHTITAVYAGDSNDNGSTSTGVTITVSATPSKGASTTMLIATPTSITAGSPVALTATVAGNSGTLPTGVVTFLDGAASIGAGTLNSMGVATLSTTALAVGVQSLTASYAGDANFNASVSSAVSVTVAAQVATDFSLSLTPAAATVSRGSSTQTTIILTAIGGFAGPVNLSCSGLPVAATCSFSAATVNVANGVGNATMTVQTKGQTAQARATRKTGFGRAIHYKGESALALISFSGLLGWTLRKRRLAIRLCTVLLGAGLLALAGCGGAGEGTSVATTPTGTPAGSYAINVTANSGTLTHAVSFTVVVQ